VGLQVNNHRDRIFNAVRHGNVELFQGCLDRGMDLNQRDAQGNSLLHVACQNGSKRLVKSILREGYDINSTNSQGHTPLYFAIKYKYFKLAKYLISKDAQSSNIDEMQKRMGKPKEIGKIAEKTIPKDRCPTLAHLESTWCIPQLNPKAEKAMIKTKSQLIPKVETMNKKEDPSQILHDLGIEVPKQQRAKVGKLDFSSLEREARRNTKSLPPLNRQSLLL